MIKRLLTLLLFARILLASDVAHATHIVGGDITVRWVSGNDFEITLIFIRDCAGVPMPGTVTLGIYDQVTNALQQSVSITQTSNDILTLGDACYAPSFCRQRGIYKKTVNIPDNVNGYYIQYGDCCRNHAITNISSPGNTGFVYYCEMPDPALHNSSPVFAGIPDGYMCNGYTNTDNFSATDADGDVLVYSFTTPLSGSGLAPKPYGTITWQPGYSTTNSMGDPSMVINPATGVINTTPPNFGIFVFSVKVEEYRAGIKIGEINRDFQYQILNCQILSLAVFTGNTICKGSSATITANGVSPGFSYSWAPGGQTTSSIVVSPATAGNHTYTVTTVNGPCSSISTTTLTVNATPTAVVTVTGDPCAGISNSLTASGGISYNWNTGAVGSVLTGVAAGTYTVSVTNALNCTSTATGTIAPLVSSDYVWTGAGSTGVNNWFDSNNWNNGNGCLPSCLTNVIIPNVANDPDIGTALGPASCKNITLATGAKLSFSSTTSELDICGDFYDNGVTLTQASKGVLKFMGNVPQSFYKSNTSGGNNFHNVILANTASLPTLTIKEGIGYKDLILDNTGVFTFQSGVLVTEGGRKLVLNNTATGAITGYGVNSYVYGTLKRFVVNGTTYYFPVGGAPVAGNSYPYELMKIDFTSISGGLTDLSVFFENPPNYTGTGLPVSEVSPASGQYTDLLDNGGSNTGVGYPGGYGGLWTILPNTGTATYDLTLYGRNYSPGSVGSYEHSIISRDEFCPASWAMKGAYMSSSVSGGVVTAFRSGMVGFSQKGIAKVMAPLPVELLSFDAACEKNKTLLSWSTASETNNDHFTIERSCDQNLLYYQNLITIPGAGNSNSIKQYSFYDNDETSGECYYRLSQTDLDGNITVFAPISINCKDNASFNFIGILPNPAENIMSILFHSDQEENVTILITDVLGKQILSKKVMPEIGLNKIELDVTAYQSGIYFIDINNGKRSYIKKAIRK